MGDYYDDELDASEDAWDGDIDAHELMWEQESFRMEQAEDLSICFVTDL